MADIYVKVTLYEGTRVIKARKTRLLSCGEVGACCAVQPEKNGKETHRWGVAEIQKMIPPTTGRCK